MRLTFDTKGGPLGGLAQTGEGVELEVSRQGLDQTDGDRAFTFSQGRGSDPGERDRELERKRRRERGIEGDGEREGECEREGGRG